MSDVINLEIQRQNWEKFSKALAKSPEEIGKQLAAAIWQAEMLLQRETVEKTPTGVSRGAGLRASIISEKPQIMSDQIIGSVGTSLNYAVPVELGTKPHRPPVAPIMEWAKYKLGVTEPEAIRIGYAIANKIAKKGTEGSFMFKQAFEKNQKQVDALLNKALNKVLRGLE
ncbi:MAG: hypothetical protein AB7U85_04910 [Alphaproteobacteria bacterium]